MRHRTLAVLLMLAAAPAWAARQELLLDPSSTAVSFTLEATGHDVQGLLALESGRIEFDPETGEASGSIVIDAAKAETGNASRDGTMRNKVLEVAEFPRIEFEPGRLSGKLAAEGTSEVTLHGTVTLHGASHALALPARVDVQGGRLSAETTFTVPYQDWGLHDPSVLFLRVARVVSVTVQLSGELRPMAGEAEVAGR